MLPPEAMLVPEGHGADKGHVWVWGPTEAEVCVDGQGLMLPLWAICGSVVLMRPGDWIDAKCL